MAVPCFMVISGYVGAKSFVNHSVFSVGQAYVAAQVIPKFIRFTIPFVAAFIVEVILLLKYSVIEFDVLPIIFAFIDGGYGKGSYYYPIMIQFIFWFPVLFFIIKKYVSDLACV